MKTIRTMYHFLGFFACFGILVNILILLILTGDDPELIFTEGSKVVIYIGCASLFVALTTYATVLLMGKESLMSIKELQEEQHSLWEEKRAYKRVRTALVKVILDKDETYQEEIKTQI